MSHCSISENQSLVVMRPWWNLWLIAAVVVSMCLHFVILEVNFLAVSFVATSCASVTIRMIPEAFGFRAVHVCICDHNTKSLLTPYLIKHLWEFHLIYSFGAVRDRGEMFRFRGQKIKGQGHSESKCTFQIHRL